MPTFRINNVTETRWNEFCLDQITDELDGKPVDTAEGWIEHRLNVRIQFATMAEAKLFGLAWKLYNHLRDEQHLHDLNLEPVPHNPALGSHCYCETCERERVESEPHI